MSNTTYDDCMLVQALCMDEASASPLQSDLDALIHSLRAKVSILDKKRCTQNEQAYWIIRGRQKALQRVALQLQSLRRQPNAVTSYMFYLILREFIECLNKCCIEEEGQHARATKSGYSVEQWKDEGEMQELRNIARSLIHIVQAHTPHSVNHTLSLDGKHLISLQDTACENDF